jgi:hypothetical protein
MKKRISPARIFATAGALTFTLLPWTAALTSPTALAQEPTAAPAESQAATAPAPIAATAAAPAKLPYGVEDVVKLSRAQVSEGVILTYIQNSGTIYNLGPKEIVALRDQGVSDRVINTMIDQHRNVPQSSAPAQAPAPTDTLVAAAAPTYSYPPAPDYSQPAYAQPAATYAPASSVYVIPYPAATYAYYGSYQPYYYGYSGYYGCGYPSVSFSFGYANHYGHYGHYGHYYHHH